MKIMTILGTRPEIIRLSRVIPLLDSLSNHILVHTGQNYDTKLDRIFFEDLEVRKADYYLGCKAESFGTQLASILEKTEKLLISEKPDRLLLLGDTNSSLSAIMAKRMGIPVYHMEAGNRCYDDRVPEEVNRRIIDHCSDILMPYTERSRKNLLEEGIDGNRIFVTGNPIKEVLDYYSEKISNSNIVSQLSLDKKEYFLVTLHRAENVDIEERLRSFFKYFNSLSEKYNKPVICSIHPRTRHKLEKYNISVESEEVRILEPFGLFDFVNLEKNAFCVLSDSGTVQEECCIFKVPNVTLRDVTERPETIEVGSGILTGAEPETILRAVKAVTSRPPDWTAPEEYMVNNVSQTVSRIILGFR